MSLEVTSNLTTEVIPTEVIPTEAISTKIIPTEVATLETTAPDITTPGTSPLGASPLGTTGTTAPETTRPEITIPDVADSGDRATPSHSSLFSLDPSVSTYKQGVAQSFGHAAATYHRLGHLQRHCAHQLFQQLQSHLAPSNPALSAACPLPGPILEVGCGTGFLSAEVVQRLPHCEAVITDLSAAMVDFCRSQLAPRAAGRSASLHFQVADGEAIPQQEQPYGLIISSFALQWFKDPIQALQNWLNATAIGGWVAVAFPSNHSFPEWRSACEQSGVPYTANPLPDFQTVVAAIAPAVPTCHFATTWHHSEHPNPQHFFHHLKALGTGYRPDRATLTPAQWKHLWRTWQQQIPPEQAVTVSYHTVYLLLRR